MTALPFVLGVLGMTAIIALRYLGVSGAAAWFTARRGIVAGPADAAKRALQIRREIGWSLLSAAIYALPAGLVTVAWREHGWTRVYSDPAAHGWAWLPVSVAIYLIAHDAWFYWSHRLMHRPWWFVRVHAVHHESRPPTAWAAMAFHPWEAASGAWLFPALVFLVPIHWAALMVVLLVATFFGVTNHMGWEIFPRRLLDGPFGRGMITASHHHLHHRHYRSNYGLYFRVWDRVCGTDRGYAGEMVHEVSGMMAASGLMLLGTAPAPEPVQLEIALTGLRSSVGEVMLCVWHSPKRFPAGKCEGDGTPLRVAAAPVVRLAMPLAPGDYAISLIDDENGNGKLDKNLLGIPKEGVGFSQNPKLVFSAPTYAATRFDVAANTTETIRMKYFL